MLLSSPLRHESSALTFKTPLPYLEGPFSTVHDGPGLFGRILVVLQPGLTLTIWKKYGKMNRYLPSCTANPSEIPSCGRLLWLERLQHLSLLEKLIFAKFVITKQAPELCSTHGPIMAKLKQ